MKDTIDRRPVLGALARAVFDQTDAPRYCDLSLQGRLSAIEMCGGKRNFAAAAPHWLGA
jgi:hypothetical protein